MRYSVKEIAVIIFCVALTLLFVLRLDALIALLMVVLSSMNALLIGGVFAFVLNVPMKKLESQLEKVSWIQSVKRPLAIASVLVAFVLIAVGVVAIILPTLTTTISQLVGVTSAAVPKVITLLEDNNLLSNEVGQKLIVYLNQFTGWDKISSYVSTFVTGLVSNVSGIFSNLASLVMAFFFTLAILTSKEHLQSMTIKLFYAFLPKKAAEILFYIGEVITDTYDKFLVSQIVEAFIIGGMVFASYSLSGIPYAAMAGILAGVLSFVPYIGPLAACIISALFVAVQAPLLALWSVVLFQLIQLIEGNIIYPRVVGQSVGLPPLFTLAAALIGGNLFGLLGMIFFTPMFAVLYRLMREWTQAQLQAKQLHIE